MGVGDAEDDGREVTGAGTQQENNSDSSNSNNLLQTMQGEPNGGVLVSKSLGAGGSLGGREDGDAGLIAFQIFASTAAVNPKP